MQNSNTDIRIGWPPTISASVHPSSRQAATSPSPLGSTSSSSPGGSPSTSSSPGLTLALALSFSLTFSLPLALPLALSLSLSLSLALGLTSLNRSRHRDIVFSVTLVHEVSGVCAVGLVSFPLKENIRDSKLTENSIAVIAGLHAFNSAPHRALGAHVVLSEEMGRGDGAQHEGGDGRGAEGGEWAVHGDEWVYCCCCCVLVCRLGVEPDGVEVCGGCLSRQAGMMQASSMEIWKSMRRKQKKNGYQPSRWKN